jgi:regulatory protein
MVPQHDILCNRARLWHKLGLMPPPTRRAQKHPVSAQQLRQLALSFVARYATSQARLTRYLQRKLSERGWETDDLPPISQIVAQMVDMGFVDDEVFATSRKDSLIRRGYGEARVRSALHQAGIDAETTNKVIEIEEDRAFEIALSYARKRRLGPYFIGDIDQKLRQKQLASLLRAGHNLTIALQILDLDAETVHTSAQ